MGKTITRGYGPKKKTKKKTKKKFIKSKSARP